VRREEVAPNFLRLVVNDRGSITAPPVLGDLGMTQVYAKFTGLNEKYAL
jgi:hypothetical protein